jgi:hypothetical protein
MSACSNEIKNLQQQKNKSDKIIESVCKELQKIGDSYVYICVLTLYCI